MLNQGLERNTPLSFGVANILVSLLVLLTAWLLGARIGLGTFANAILIGLYIEALLAWPLVAGLGETWPVGARLALVLAGIGLMGAGTALYIGAALGAGPRDSLMLVGAARSRRRIGVVRAVIESCALLAGWLLGGTVGVGTVAFALLIGPSVELSFSLLRRSPLARPDEARSLQVSAVEGAVRT